MDTPEVSVVIPVFNDAGNLETAVPKTIETLDRLRISFEIIIAEDGSFDGTRERAEAFAKKDPRIILDHSDERRGKGGAISDALARSRGKYFCFLDVDLSTDLKHLGDVLTKLNEGYDVVIGSRMLANSQVVRSTNREFSSKGFNLLVQKLLGSKIHDHQCGFKGFRADALKHIIPYVHSRGWTWDTEVLTLAEAAGFSILEIPVTWTQGASTNVHLSDYVSMGREVVALSKRVKSGTDLPPRR